MRISDWSSDVCSSDLNVELRARRGLRVGTARKRMPHRRWPAHGPWPPRQHLMAVRVHRSCQADDRGPARPPPRRTAKRALARAMGRSEEHTSELQSLMRISYAVFCLKKKQKTPQSADRDN